MELRYLASAPGAAEMKRPLPLVKPPVNKEASSRGEKGERVELNTHNM